MLPVSFYLAQLDRQNLLDAKQVLQEKKDF